MSRRHKRKRKRPLPKRPADNGRPVLDDLVAEDLLPQYDTVNEEPYFTTADGRTLTTEEAGQVLLRADELARKGGAT